MAYVQVKDIRAGGKNISHILPLREVQDGPHKFNFDVFLEHRNIENRHVEHRHVEHRLLA